MRYLTIVFLCVLVSCGGVKKVEAQQKAQPQQMESEFTEAQQKEIMIVVSNMCKGWAEAIAKFMHKILQDEIAIINYTHKADNEHLKTAIQSANIDNLVLRKELKAEGIERQKLNDKLLRLENQLSDISVYLFRIGVTFLSALGVILLFKVGCHLKRRVYENRERAKDLRV